MTIKSRRTSLIAARLIPAPFPMVSNAAPPLAPDDFRYDIYSDTVAELFWNRTTNVPVAGYEITKNSELNGGIRAPVPQTGQRVSERPGDDGDLQAGVPWPDPRLTLGVAVANDLNENGVCDGDETCDGTVTDNLTGLVRLRDANCFGERDWFDAIDLPRTLAGDGSSDCALNDDSQVGDWRLPNIREIQSLMDYGNSFPDPLLPEGHPFVDVQIGGITSAPAEYWTSTSTGSGNGGAYSVSISVGWVERLSTDGTNFTRFVWPVRNAN